MTASEDANSHGSQSFRSISDFFSSSSLSSSFKPPPLNANANAGNNPISCNGEESSDDDEDTLIIKPGTNVGSRHTLVETSCSSSSASEEEEEADTTSFKEDKDESHDKLPGGMNSISSSSTRAEDSDDDSDVEILISLPSSDSDSEQDVWNGNDKKEEDNQEDSMVLTSEAIESESDLEEEMTLPTKKSKVATEITQLQEQLNMQMQERVAEPDDDDIYIEPPQREFFVLTKEIISPALEESEQESSENGSVSHDDKVESADVQQQINVSVSHGGGGGGEPQPSSDAKQKSSADVKQRRQAKKQSTSSPPPPVTSSPTTATRPAQARIIFVAADTSNTEAKPPAKIKSSRAGRNRNGNGKTAITEAGVKPSANSKKAKAQSVTEAVQAAAAANDDNDSSDANNQQPSTVTIVPSIGSYRQISPMPEVQTSTGGDCGEGKQPSSPVVSSMDGLSASPQSIVVAEQQPNVQEKNSSDIQPTTIASSPSPSPSPSDNSDETPKFPVVPESSKSSPTSTTAGSSPPVEPATAAMTMTSRSAYVYDQRMLLHKNLFELDHPECPERVSRIHDHLLSLGLLQRSRMLLVDLDIPGLEANLMRVHDAKYHKLIQSSSCFEDEEDFANAGTVYNSVYLNQHSALSASVAAAATIQLCRAVASGDYDNGFAIVRPPGHHAEHDEAMGFCLYNNVAVAAANLYHTGLAKKIMIVDWDVHHGNGTQNAFVDNPDILYVSLHRYDNGSFYPHMVEANHTYVGVKPALGRSVNIAWNGPGYGDGDYLYAFSRLIMPIAREFNPDFVILSAGFDAAQGDPIGQCMVTPFGYASMLHELLSLAEGKVAVVLEGGYDLDVITRCYEACVRTLLKEPLPKAPSGALVASLKAVASVEAALSSQSPHWRCLYPKLAELPSSLTEPNAADKEPILTPMRKILDTFWREECSAQFALKPMPLLFSSIKDQAFLDKYVPRLLVQEKCLFGPDVLLVFAHETGPLLHTGVVPSMCLQPGRIFQYTPFLDLMQACSTIGQADDNVGLVNLCVPSRPWKLKQQAFDNERECEELRVLMLLLWDQLIARSGCKRVVFVGAGAPTFGIANLLLKRDITGIVQGLFFFSSSLYLPLVDAPGMAEWYRRNSMVVVPSAIPKGTVIPQVQDKFGTCVSAGQVMMADSAAVVSLFAKEVLDFIREKTKKI